MREDELRTADEDQLVRSPALGGVLKGTWLGAAFAVAVCAGSFSIA